MTIEDVLSEVAGALSPLDKRVLTCVRDRVSSFVRHLGRNSFFGYGDSTLASIMLSLVQSRGVHLQALDAGDDKGTTLLDFGDADSESKGREGGKVEEEGADMPTRGLVFELRRSVRHANAALLHLLTPEALVLHQRTIPKVCVCVCVCVARTGARAST